MGHSLLKFIKKHPTDPMISLWKCLECSFWFETRQAFDYGDPEECPNCGIGADDEVYEEWDT